jgi:hypothetical protein
VASVPVFWWFIGLWFFMPGCKRWLNADFPRAMFKAKQKNECKPKPIVIEG